MIINILHFDRNGSIIVDFIVKYLQDPKLNKKVVVADELKKEIIETGKLGQYSLKSVKIKGKNNYN